MKITLKYSFIFALVGLGITACIIFLSRIFLILGVAIASFIIGFIFDYIEAINSLKGRKRKK